MKKFLRTSLALAALSATPAFAEEHIQTGKNYFPEFQKYHEALAQVLRTPKKDRPAVLAQYPDASFPEIENIGVLVVKGVRYVRSEWNCSAYQRTEKGLFIADDNGCTGEIKRILSPTPEHLKKGK